MGMACACYSTDGRDWTWDAKAVLQLVMSMSKAAPSERAALDVLIQQSTAEQSNVQCAILLYIVRVISVGEGTLIAGPGTGSKCGGWMVDADGRLQLPFVLIHQRTFGVDGSTPIHLHDICPMAAPALRGRLDGM